MSQTVPLDADLSRPFTWLEHSLLQHSDLLKVYVADRVTTIVDTVKAHVTTQLAAGNTIHLAWDPQEGIAGVAVHAFARDLVRDRVEAQVRELGLTFAGNAWKPVITAGYIAPSFRIVLAKHWGEVSDEQFAALIKPYQKRAEKAAPAS
jgi:hypothetical protein